MSVFSYILLALSVALSSMITVRSSAEAYPVRLTRGLGVSFLVAAIQSIMFALGMTFANLLPQFEYQEYNNLIFIGLAVLVAVRYLYSVFSKNKQSAAFDISKWGVTAALAVAIGMNVLLLGLAVGFKVQFSEDCYKSLIPLFVAVLISTYLAIMLGRQKLEIKTRRWLFFATIFLLVFILNSALSK